MQEKHALATGILAVLNGYLGDRGMSLLQGSNFDATRINTPNSTKNKVGERAPEMHQTMKDNQYNFGAKAHIDAEIVLVLVQNHAVNQVNSLVNHGFT
ncbi:hypothetical protein D3C85_1633870 [compost metagenome]